MKKLASLCLLSIMAFQTSAQSPTFDNHQRAKNIIKSAFEAHGGQSRIAQLPAITIDYDYNTTYLTQGYGFSGIDNVRQQPGNLLVSVDFENQKARADNLWTYMETFHRRISDISKEKSVSYDMDTKDYASNVNRSFEQATENVILRDPVLILKGLSGALPSLRYLGEEAIEGKSYHSVSAALKTGTTLTLYVDKASSRINKVDLIQRQSVLEYDFEGWVNKDDFVFAQAVAIKRSHANYPGTTYYRAATFDLTARPDSVVKLPQGYSQRVAHNIYDGQLRTQDLGHGVFWSTRNGSNTLFVEFDDHLMAIGGMGLIADRITEIRKHVPDKPFKYMVTSHHHHDHLAAVPHFSDMGSKIVAAPEYQHVVEDMFAGGENNRIIAFDLVGKAKTYTDGKQKVQVFKLDNLLHANTMLLTYIPALKMVYMPDHFFPPMTNQAAIARLLEEMDKLGIEVEQLVSGHGNTLVSKQTLVKMANTPTGASGFRRQPHSWVIPKS